MASFSQPSGATKLLTLGLTLSLCSAPAHGKTRKTSSKQQNLAVFEVSGRNGARPIARAVDAALARLLPQASLPTVSFDAAAQEQAVRCHSNNDCLARIANGAGASQAVVGRVVTRGSSKRVELELVDAASGRSTQRIVFEVKSANEVDAGVRQHFQQLFGVSCPESDDGLALELVPIAPKDSGPDTSPQHAAEIVAIPIDGRGGGAAAAPEVARPTPAYLTYAGIAAATVGAAFLAAALYSGLDAQSAYVDANARSADGQLRVSAPRARQLKQQGDSATVRANVFLAVGGLLAAGGGGLIAYDTWWAHPKASLSIGSGSAHGWVSWAF